LARAITFALLIAALFSTGLIALSTRNYLEGIGAATSVHFRLSNLELSEKDNPKVRMYLLT